MTPELMQEIAVLVGTIASAVVAFASVVIRSYVKTYTGVKIEEKHMLTLQIAAETWAQDAVLRGVGPASSDLVEDFMEYARRSVPDAVSAIVTDSEVVEKIAKKYLVRAVNRVIPGERFDLPSPQAK